MPKIAKKSSLRDIITYTTACFSFAFGLGLTLAGFIVEPLGTISNSVLWVLGQCLIYTGACIGISMHYQSELTNFKNKIQSQINGYKDDSTEKDN